jgi:hypothetical protein
MIVLRGLHKKHCASIHVVCSIDYKMQVEKQASFYKITGRRWSNITDKSLRRSKGLVLHLDMSSPKPAL